METITETKKNFKDLKEYLKTTAQQIKEDKNRRKQDNRGNESLWEIQMRIFSNKRDFRHHLIAYCEMRGMKRELIEKPAENNLPSESTIAEIKTQYEACWPSREKKEEVHA